MRGSISDRFRPSVKDRLHQSKAAKQQNLRHAQREKSPVRGLVLADARQTILVDRVQMIADFYTTGSGATAWQTATTLADDPWHIWTDTCTAAATRTAWVQWSRGTTVQLSNAATHAATAEQRAAQDAEIARWQARERERLAQRDIEVAREDGANRRAMELLCSCLNDEQKRTLLADRYFLVRAPSGRLYRIDQGTHGNVKVVDPRTKRVLESLCIQPSGVPVGDSMLVQKLMIETAEDAFRKHANITVTDSLRLIRGVDDLLDGPRALLLRAA